MTTGGAVLVFASHQLLSCLLVGTVLVFASRHLLSCLLVVTVLVFASRLLLSCNHQQLLFWCLLAVTCCHVCWWLANT